MHRPAESCETRPALDATASPTRTASDVAARAAAAWHGSRTSSGIDIPLGVVATLAQFQQPTDGHRDLAATLEAQTFQDLWQVLERVWARQWLRRPELVEWARPLHQWLTEEPEPQQLAAVGAVARAALAAGQLELTAAPDPLARCRTDLLSCLLLELRSEGARQGLGEIHTPPEVSELMARMTLPDAFRNARTGAWLEDPAAGTGGLIRAAALHLRETGQDPHAYGWSMGDIDPLAAACCAVNAIVWDLGPNVLVRCGDVLAEPDGAERVWRERAEIFAHRDRVLGVAVPAAVSLRAFSLLDAEGGGEAEGGD